MKLLVKTNRYYILFSLLAFIIGGLIFYIIISTDIYGDADESLSIKKDQINEFLKKKDTLPDLSDSFDTLFFINVVVHANPDRFADTSFCSKEENSEVDYRELVFTQKFHNKIYQFIITKSQIESDDIIQGIIFSMFLVFIILLIILISFNYYLSKKIWKPFYHTLDSLGKFDLQNKIIPEIEESNINEFKKLNEVLRTMMEKMLKDFSIHKEFSENASHEMKTPLAIIKSKLELLMQSDNYTDNQIKLIQNISDTVNRLSRINNALLIITKIENKQYSVKEDIDIGIVIRRHMQNFEELISEKKINAKINIHNSLLLQMNPLLADMMIMNLISNAIKHNIPNGNFFITQTDKVLTFENSGPPLNFNTDYMFERFAKDRLNPDSLGLGLYIVKKIAENSDVKIEYHYENNDHIFNLSL